MSGARETRAHRAIFLDNADRPGADALADRLIGDHQDGDVVVMAGTRAGERAPDPDCSFGQEEDRKSTSLNSRPLMRISYAVFCLKKHKMSCSQDEDNINN